MRADEQSGAPRAHGKIVVHGARCAIGAQETVETSIEIVDGRISGIKSGSSWSSQGISKSTEIDMSGFLIMPGLINAHDHLEYSLFPRLAASLYRNYVEWGDDIHDRFPDVIARHGAVPKDVRVWWGGIRNLLSGVTTVSHHNPLRSEMLGDDFPVRVVREYGWGHSLALGGDLRAAHAATPKGRAFIVHACEGVDERSRSELGELDELGVLDDHTVLVHGLAIDGEGIALMRQHRTSLIVCPSSNKFLFGRVPDMSLVHEIENASIGNDSPLTAAGDLLDEIGFAVRNCVIAPSVAYRMVTEAPAAALRLKDNQGSIDETGVADLIAVRDTGHDAAHRITSLSTRDVEFVMIGGRVQLASGAVLQRLPLSAKEGLEPLSIGGEIRWLRAPVRELMRKAEAVLGEGQARLGGRAVCMPACAVGEHAC
jgi:cytosine/adenosine deaminase-related metal-dependent hydrolase